MHGFFFLLGSHALIELVAVPSINSFTYRTKRKVWRNRHLSSLTNSGVILVILAKVHDAYSWIFEKKKHRVGLMLLLDLRITTDHNGTLISQFNMYVSAICKMLKNGNH